VAHLISSSTPLAFLTVRQIRKATSPSEFQVKNRQKTISTEEQLDVISLLEKGAQTGDVCCNIRFTHSSYVQRVIILTELEKGLSQDLKSLCSKSTTVLSQ